MRFYYNMNDVKAVNHASKFYTEESIRSIRVYPATLKLDRDFEDNEHSSLWMIHDASKKSNEFVECANLDEAYRYLLHSENLSITEYMLNC